MDVLDVMVPSEERETLDDDIRPAWTKGMTCPVVACGGRKYDNYSQVRLHWNQVHLPYITYFCCERCNFRSPRRNQVQRHYRQRHTLSLEEAKLVSVAGKELHNAKFVDPGDKTMPIVKVSPGMALRREEAAARRLMESGRFDTSVLISRTITVARDQEVVPLGRGQAIIQDKSHWLRGSAMSRENYEPVETDFSQFDSE
ncbi:hypothetical protein KP79_PYT03432 [Mizuhopecten yessoensis]|uniref:C2H2-type domain-containing protein n=1 Tax=Mizuhopecten yessoensis TaxID=6573 RepID=A0A210PDH8_MIZYE|nr:hypothetical protein KP79_PYT03432 [Mizuhopecten yessoensis]